MSFDNRMRLHDDAERWLKANDPSYETNRYLWSTRPTDALCQPRVALTDTLPDPASFEGQRLVRRFAGTSGQSSNSHVGMVGARAGWEQVPDAVPAADDRPKKRLRQHRPWHGEARTLRKQGWGYSRIAKKVGVNVSSVYALVGPKKA